MVGATGGAIGGGVVAGAGVIGATGTGVGVAVAEMAGVRVSEQPIKTEAVPTIRKMPSAWYASFVFMRQQFGQGVTASLPHHYDSVITAATVRLHQVSLSSSGDVWSKARSQSCKHSSDVSGLPGNTHSCGDDGQCVLGHFNRHRPFLPPVISTWRPVKVLSQSRQKRLSSRDVHSRKWSPARSAASLSSGVRCVGSFTKKRKSADTCIASGRGAVSERNAYRFAAVGDGEILGDAVAVGDVAASGDVPVLAPAPIPMSYQVMPQ